jgi:hypothetical protein
MHRPYNPGPRPVSPAVPFSRDYFAAIDDDAAGAEIERAAVCYGRGCQRALLAWMVAAAAALRGLDRPSRDARLGGHRLGAAGAAQEADRQAARVASE